MAPKIPPRYLGDSFGSRVAVLWVSAPPSALPLVGHLPHAGEGRVLISSLADLSDECVGATEGGRGDGGAGGGRWGIFESMAAVFWVSAPPSALPLVGHLPHAGEGGVLISSLADLSDECFGATEGGRGDGGAAPPTY